MMDLIITCKLKTYINLRNVHETFQWNSLNRLSSLQISDLVEGSLLSLPMSLEPLTLKISSLDSP